MDERMSESAAEVIAVVIRRAEDDAYLHGAWNSRPEVDPQAVLDALREAGYGVVKLPEPTGRWAEGPEWRDFISGAIHAVVWTGGLRTEPREVAMRYSSFYWEHRRKRGWVFGPFRL